MYNYDMCLLKFGVMHTQAGRLIALPSLLFLDAMASLFTSDASGMRRSHSHRSLKNIFAPHQTPQQQQHLPSN